jgi:hypothetical protein
VPGKAIDGGRWLDPGEGGWKSRVLQKGGTTSDNIQVLTKDMHAETNGLQCSPSSGSFCAEKERQRTMKTSVNSNLAHRRG